MSETVIRYLDRFLMFYVRTADRLERTATWFNKLEGGIDYLRRVVVDDALGIAAELERDMQHVVDTYQCEWKTTIDDPEKLKLFRPFINSDAVDPSLGSGSAAPSAPDSPVERKGRAGQGRNLMFTPLESAAEAGPARRGDAGWVDVCALASVIPNTGVCALLGGKQVAVFRVGDSEVYALSNFDPFSQAFVLSRGIVGDRAGIPKVASPIFKQNFNLRTGQCLDDPNVTVPVYPVRVQDGRVEVQVAGRVP